MSRLGLELLRVCGVWRLSILRGGTLHGLAHLRIRIAGGADDSMDGKWCLRRGRSIDWWKASGSNKIWTYADSI